MNHAARTERNNVVDKLFEEERKDGYRNGIAEGYAVAQRIFVWFSTNHQLNEPKHIDQLREWSNIELTKLKKNLANE